MKFKEFIDSEENFEQVLAEIDTQLKVDGVSIPRRSITGLGEVSKRFGITLSWNSSEAKKISAWFTTKYGERMLVDFSPGSTVVQISGDNYEVKFPLILGSIKVNVFEWILKITPKTLSSLNETQLDSLGSMIFKSYQDFQYMKSLPQEISVELHTAAEHLTREEPQYGLSSWASLQAVEKALKAFIKKSGKAPPPIHDLTKLAEIAEELGHPPISRDLLENAQCSPGVRYDIPVSNEKAVTALHSSIKICASIGKSFN